MNQRVIKAIVIGGVVCMSTSALFGRLVETPAVLTAMYRMLFTALLLLPMVIGKHWDELRTIRPKNLLLCLSCGVILAIHFTAYMQSVKYTRIASATVLVDTEVLFVALMLLVFLRERIPRAGLIGIALTMAGSVLIALGDSGSGTHVVYGDLLALLGAVCSAAYTLIGRDQRRYLSTTTYTFLVYSAAAVTLCITALVTGQRFTGYPVSSFGYILGMAVLCTLLGHSIFSWGLKYISAAFISMAKLGEPVFASVMACFLFAEYPKGNQIVGGAIVIFGIAAYLFAKEGEPKGIDNTPKI